MRNSQSQGLDFEEGVVHIEVGWGHRVVGCSTLGEIGHWEHHSQIQLSNNMAAMGLSPVMNFQEWPGYREWPTSPSCHVMPVKILFLEPFLLKSWYYRPNPPT